MNGRQVIGMVVITGLVAGVAALASAQSPPARLTLDDAIARSLETSHQLAEVAARLDASQAAVRTSDAANRPQVAAIAGYTRTNHVDEFGFLQAGGAFRLIYPDVPDNYRTRLDLQWPVYSGGRADALQRAAQGDAAAVGEDLTTARADLRLEVTRAFWALVTADETVDVLQEAVRRVEAHLADIRNRQAVGLVPPNEVLSAEAQRSRQQVGLIDARARRDAAMADLARLAGLPADTPITLDVTLTPGVLPPDSPSALIERARAERPERRAIVDRLTAAGARVDVAAAAMKPQLSVAGGVDYANPNPRIFPRADRWHGSWDAGFNVAWSIWDGGRARAQVGEASASERAARERLADFDSRLDVDVRQRRLELESSLAAIRAAEDAVRSATEARRVVTDRFRAGVATSTEVLDAQTDLLNSQLERTRALANSRLAEARLDRVTGR
jgi:outer membrane protein TolC